MPKQTKHPFTLPMGYIDENEVCHREGVMRLATGADEILPQADIRVQQNPAYLMVIVLSRVVIQLGQLSMITPKIIEGLFTEDLAYLIDMYNRINKGGLNAIAATCPKCQHAFQVEVKPQGE